MTLTQTQFDILLPLKVKVQIGKINYQHPLTINLPDLYCKLIKCDKLTKEEVLDERGVIDRIAVHYKDVINRGEFYQIIKN